MKEINLKIDGMHCMGCALGLEENLEKLDFVKEASADFKEANVNIKYTLEGFDLSKIKKVVEDMNFHIME